MSAPPEIVRNPLAAIGLKVASVVIFVAMASLIKAAGQLPAGQIVFFRSFFAVFPILAVLAWRHELRHSLSTSRPLAHLLRGSVGVVSMGFGFFALTRLPLPEAITLNYAQPLLVVVFSALFLHERIRAYRWSAVAVGLIGVLVISWPKLTLFGAAGPIGREETEGVLAALTAAGLSAIAMLTVRNLVITERTSTIVLWFSLSAAVLSLASLPLGWASISATQWALLVSSGICGGIAQILMTESYRHAEASTVAPFEYTSMLVGIVIGYLAFGDLPTEYTLIGGAIVIGSGVFIIWRERQLGLERSRAKQAAPPQ